MTLNNHVMRRICGKQLKNSKMVGFHPARKWEKNLPMVPPLDHFQGKIKIAHLMPEQSVRQDDRFFTT